MTIPKLSTQRSRSPVPEQSPSGSSLRPSISRTSTYDTSAREDSPARRLARVPTDSSTISSSRNNLRPVRRASSNQQNAFADDYEDDYDPSAGNGYRRNDRDRSPPSPDTASSVGSARGSAISRAASWTAASEQGGNGKKAPPPPPPSRAKKPPPPPPPMKRSALSETKLARY